MKHFTGEVINGFELITRHDTKGYWLCKCLTCNKEHIKHMNSLMYRKVPNCGCNKDHLLNLTGRRFGRLTVLRRGEHVKYKPRATSYKWHCICDCGKRVQVHGNSLIQGQTKSCGCSRIKARTEAELRLYTSGLVKRTRISWYKSWVRSVKNLAKNRCEVCGSTTDIQAHHVIEWSYLRFRPNIRAKIGMGRALCKACHIDYHSICGQTKHSHPQFLAYQGLRNTVPNFLELPKQERKQLMQELEKYITDLFERLQTLEDERKALAEEIKESIKVFAENNELEAEAVAEGYKKYKKYLKDPDKFILVDYSIDKVLHSFVKEYQEDKQKQLASEE